MSGKPSGVVRVPRAVPTPFPGHSAPAAGFEVPLEMLAACHGRVQAQGETLLKLQAHLARHGVDEDARTAARAVLRYFDLAAPLHHRDEEEDLFPALRACAEHDGPGPPAADAARDEAADPGGRQALLQLLATLTDQHRGFETQWAALRPALQAVADGPPDQALPCLDGAADFVAAYAAHIALEEGELLPLAVRWLDAPVLDRVGRAMRLRRGVGEG